MISNIFNAPYREFGRTSIAAIFMFLTTIVVMIAQYLKITNSTTMYVVVSLLALIFFLFNFGYYIEYSRNVLNGNHNLPPWADLFRYWLNGLKALVAYAIYLVPGIIFLGITNYIISLNNVITTPSLILFGIGVAYMILIFYILPAILVTFSYNEEFGEAFLIGAILRRAFTLKYLGRFVLYLAYLAGITLVAIAFTAIVAFIFSLFVSGSAWLLIVYVTSMIFLSIARPIVDLSIIGLIAHMYEGEGY